MLGNRKTRWRGGLLCRESEGKGLGARVKRGNKMGAEKGSHHSGLLQASQPTPLRHTPGLALRPLNVQNLQLEEAQRSLRWLLGCGDKVGPDACLADWWSCDPPVGRSTPS